jgi:hypothetical protein
MEKVDIENAGINVLVEMNGGIHLAGMAEDEFEAIKFLIKRSIVNIIPTGKTQAELLEFVNYKDV